MEDNKEPWVRGQLIIRVNIGHREATLRNPKGTFFQERTLNYS